MTAATRALNATVLGTAARLETFRNAGLLLPSVLLIAILLAPFVWLSFFSFFWEGVPSFENYQRMIDNPSYGTILLTTFRLSITVTLVVVVLGYPTTYAIALLPGRWAILALACVAIPFWTSLLVRTYAWMVILQRKGLLNTWLIDLGLIDTPVRFANSFLGTTIGMVHIMLPFFIFPLYASLKLIDRDLIRAANGLGASPARAFLDIFLPLSRPGVIAGSLLTFILCLGFYVTPQLLGGDNVTTIAMKILQNVATYAEWGPASALGVVLLVWVAALLGLIRWLGGRAAARGARP